MLTSAHNGKVFCRKKIIIRSMAIHLRPQIIKILKKSQQIIQHSFRFGNILTVALISIITIHCTVQ
jgi:hypothetical protein